MKKKVLIILGIVIVLLLVIYGVIFLIDFNNISQGKLPIFAIKSDTENYKGLGYSVKVKYYKDTNSIEKIEMFAFGKTVAEALCSYAGENNDNNKDIVIIQDKKIKNENLLNDFIEKANNKETATLQINNRSNNNTEIIKLEYVPGENSINNSASENTNSISENVTVISKPPNKEWTAEDYQKYYGYYKMTKNDKEEKFDNLRWKIKKKTTENTVQVIFYEYLLELTEIPVICEYTLDNSLYEKKYDLTYMQRKDMGVKQIAKINQFDNTDFEVYTLGGDVTITIEQDMVYSLEEALNQKIITVNSILEQAKLDEEYGICETAFYQDGGSTEYRYKDYTILKFNTLDGNKDLIIGMSDSIINNESLKNNYSITKKCNLH